MQLWFLPDRGVLNTKLIDFRKILVFSALIIPVAILVFTLAGILKKTTVIEDRLISEFSASNEQIEIIKKNLIKISSDVNQTRSLVGLPETEYSFEKKSETNSEDSSTGPDTDNTVYFLGFEYLKNHFNEIELNRNVSDIAVSEIFKTSAEKNSFIIREDENKYYLNDSVSGKTLFSLEADISENTVILKPFFDIMEKGVFTSDFQVKTADYLNKNASEAKSLNKKLSDNIVMIKNLPSDPSVKSSLKSNRLYLDNFNSGIDKTCFSIKNESGIAVAEIVLSHSDFIFSFCNKNYTDFKSMKNDLINIRNICDIRTQDEKRIEKSRNDLESLSTDSSFKDYLTDKGFSLSNTVREDNDYFYYDILSSSTNIKIGSFAVHKVSGEIYLTDHEEIPLSSINMFSNISKKKN